MIKEDTQRFGTMEGLHLGFPVAVLASGIGEAADIMLSHTGITAESIAAASVYFASNIPNQPRN